MCWAVVVSSGGLHSYSNSHVTAFVLVFLCRMLKVKVARQDFIFSSWCHVTKLLICLKHNRHCISSKTISGLYGLLLWWLCTFKFWGQNYSFESVSCSLVLGFLISLLRATRFCVFGFHWVVFGVSLRLLRIEGFPPESAAAVLVT